MSQLTACPACNKEFSINAPACVHCGEPNANAEPPQVSSAFSWIMAIFPFIIFPWIFSFPDTAMIRKAKLTPPSKWWAFIFAPIYLYKRSTVLKTGRAQFWVSIAMVALYGIASANQETTHSSYSAEFSQAMDQTLCKDVKRGLTEELNDNMGSLSLAVASGQLKPNEAQQVVDQTSEVGCSCIKNYLAENLTASVQQKLANAVLTNDESYVAGPKANKTIFSSTQYCLIEAGETMESLLRKYM